MLEKIKENKWYLLTILIVVICFNIKLPYYVNAPGGTINIEDRIEYKEMTEQNGSLNMLYVTEYVATLPVYLLSYVIKDWDLESIESSQISNDETPSEINTRNKIMLENSINNAMYVAYTEANCKVEIQNQKFIVIALTEDNDLKIGDEVKKINSQEIKSLTTIKQEIEKTNVGDNITLDIKRGNQEKKVEVEVKLENDQKILGMVIVTNYDLKTDPTIELKFKASESGSSGGFMMALSIYNAISGEDLLKGRNIAGTGTIDMEGNVGEIAGIKYKIMGAANNNMDIVFVPRSNYEEAIKVKKEKNYDLKIIEVKTLKDAIEYLKNTK